MIMRYERYDALKKILHGRARDVAQLIEGADGCSILSSPSNVSINNVKSALSELTGIEKNKITHATQTHGRGKFEIEFTIPMNKEKLVGKLCRPLKACVPDMPISGVTSASQDTQRPAAPRRPNVSPVAKEGSSI